MSGIPFMVLIVALFDTVSINGQSTVGSDEVNDLNFADETQSQILNEIRYLQSQVRISCDNNCSQFEHFLGRHLSNITDTLHGVSNRLGAMDQNVRNGKEFSEDLQLQFRNLSMRYEKQVNDLKSIGNLLKEHDQHTITMNQSEASKCDRQVTPSVVTWPRDCADIRKVGQNVSDVYEVSVLGPGSMPVEFSVYCDMNSSDTSWLVFQRRKDGSENFERTWIEYRNGFGNLRAEFWLGNNALHLLTSNRNYKLRIEMEDFEGDKRYAEYEQFTVGPASDKYRLNISGYSGDAGDSMYAHNGHMFSTVDADHDNIIYSCAQLYHGAWWYKGCHSSNLNGLYLRGNHTSYADGVEWQWFRGHHYSLMWTEMKIAPRN